MKTRSSEIIGKKIKTLRTAKNLTLRELADTATSYMPDDRKIGFSAIAYYEKGRSADLDVLNALCKALDVDMMDILSEAFAKSRNKK